MMKKKTRIFYCALAVFFIASIVWAGTVSEKPYGVATPYWYGYSAGAKSDYYLSHPTLTSNDEAVGKAASQTLTNKILTSPVISDSVYIEGDTEDAYETAVAVEDPTADRTITLPDYTGSVPIIVDQSGDTNFVVNSSTDVEESSVTPQAGWWVDGKTLRWEVGGTIAGQNAAKEFKLKVGTTEICSISTAANAEGDYKWTVTVQRGDDTISGVTEIGHAELSVASGDTVYHTDFGTSGVSDFASGTTCFRLEITSGNAADFVYTRFLRIWHWFKS